MALVHKWPFYNDKKCMTMLDVCVGRYWKVMTSFNGHPVYKREVTFADDGLELGQMYILYVNGSSIAERPVLTRVVVRYGSCAAHRTA